MWKKNKHHIENEKLDRFGEELLHALEASEAEIDTATGSPFLYRRIRVRIEAEQKRLSEDRGKWFALFIEVKHAIPLLAMIAMIAIVLLWYTPGHSSQTNGPSGSSQTPMMIEISPLSNDEMMASIVGWNERTPNQQKEQ